MTCNKLTLSKVTYKLMQCQLEFQQALGDN